VSTRREVTEPARVAAGAPARSSGEDVLAPHRESRTGGGSGERRRLQRRKGAVVVGGVGVGDVGGRP
jgi:hypothetical protein